MKCFECERRNRPCVYDGPLLVLVYASNGTGERWSRYFHPHYKAVEWGRTFKAYSLWTHDVFTGQEAEQA